jgi:hypothetical protein
MFFIAGPFDTTLFKGGHSFETTGESVDAGLRIAYVTT